QFTSLSWGSDRPIHFLGDSEHAFDRLAIACEFAPPAVVDVVFESDSYVSPHEDRHSGHGDLVDANAAAEEHRVARKFAYETNEVRRCREGGGLIAHYELEEIRRVKKPGVNDVPTHP